MYSDGVKIVVHERDRDKGPDSDDCYCAVVQAWSKTDEVWYNAGIVVRDKSAMGAFGLARTQAIKSGYWE